MNLELIAPIISIINIFIAYQVYKLTKKANSPKLYVSSQILDIQKTIKFGKPTNTSFTFHIEDFQLNGFPEIQHERTLWQLSIHNNDDLTVTNMKIKYTIVIKRALQNFNTDKHIETPNINDYKAISKEEHFDYIPPGNHVVINISYLAGYFLYADLKVDSLQSKERILYLIL